MAQLWPVSSSSLVLSFGGLPPSPTVVTVVLVVNVLVS